MTPFAFPPGPPVGRAGAYVGVETGQWLLDVSGLHPRSALRAKRALDMVGAGLLLVLCAPLLAVAALVVKLTSRGPVLFKQRRVGFRCQEFSMYKFRTMREGAEQEQDRLARTQRGRTFLKIDRDARITPVGRWLRRSSIDELPQLVNVLRGEMSLVGPRPVLPCDFDKFPKLDQLRRFSMNPGMTGLWQVSGRAETTFSDYVRYDLFYIQNWSLSLDLWILWRTFRAVVSGEGAH
jgi:lipopolysaccharide/colanic/teichoic acid biosynthesis glycosyltransferase